MENKENFKPYVAPEKVTPELTAVSIIIGLILAVVFGAANAYLGLRVGMTVSASIPAAVISMGILRILLKRNSVLESNIVQTMGSAGESVAAGAIFTLPALYLWASEGVSEEPTILTVSLIALVGGLLGVFFMVPLRNALIVKEHGVLPYPEGTACADVLLAGESGGANAKSVFVGMGLSAIVKFIVDGLKLIPATISIPVKPLRTAFSGQPYPALLSVGYICGIKISSYMFAGGMLGWFIIIPILVLGFGDTVLFPATVSIAEVYAENGPDAIWSSYIRYIGAGAVAMGGIISLIKSIPLIIRTFKDTIKSLKGESTKATLRTEQDLPFPIIIGAIAFLTLAVWLLPMIPVSFLGALIIVIFGFFFATVSSRMVGLVGSSNNPVSGMAIATLLVTTFILKATGTTGAAGMIAAISIGSVICIVAAIAGDTSQDLKTGYILGATPKKQQIAEVLGVAVSAFTIGYVLILLNSAYGFGSEEISAPQATLMKMIVEGVMSNQLPWILIGVGALIALVVEICRISVLPFAIGLYLPLELSTTIMLGGVIRHLIDKRKTDYEKENSDTDAGVLFSSGMIAGEGLVGILLAILTVVGVADTFDLSFLPDMLPGVASTVYSYVVGIGMIVLLALLLFKVGKTGPAVVIEASDDDDSEEV